MESGARQSSTQTPGTCDGGATNTVSDPLLSLSDNEIQEKIERLTSFLYGNHLSSLPDKGLKLRVQLLSSLPDRGLKLRVQLQQLKEEQERRRQHPVRVVDKDRMRMSGSLSAHMHFLKSNAHISDTCLKYFELTKKMIEWLQHVPKDSSEYVAFKKKLQEIRSILFGGKFSNFGDDHSETEDEDYYCGDD